MRIYIFLKLQKNKKRWCKKVNNRGIKKKKVHLYDEVKDRLENSAYLLSGGQQQRLILARAFDTKTKSFTSWWTNCFIKWRVSIKNRKFDFRVKKSCLIVIISHFKSQILNVADSIFSLEY